MLATVADLLHDLLRVTVSVNTPKTKRNQIPKPWHWPRPHEKRKAISVRDLARRLRG